MVFAAKHKFATLFEINIMNMLKEQWNISKNLCFKSYHSHEFFDMVISNIIGHNLTELFGTDNWQQIYKQTKSERMCLWNKVLIRKKSQYYNINVILIT